jgi:hypothetical protein
VCGVAKIILSDQDLSSDGEKNNEFLFLINKKKDGVAT